MKFQFFKVLLMNTEKGTLEWWRTGSTNTCSSLACRTAGAGA